MAQPLRKSATERKRLIGSSVERIEDLRLLRASLGSMEEAKNLADATIVHSVWWGGILEIPRAQLSGKKVVCQFDNPPFHWVKQESFRDAREIVGLWVVQSKQAKKQADLLGLPNVFIPYKVNTEIFRPWTAEDRLRIRASLSIPDPAFVVGNFHRDTEGGSLNKPKTQKNPELILEIDFVNFNNSSVDFVLNIVSVFFIEIDEINKNLSQNKEDIIQVERRNSIEIIDINEKLENISKSIIVLE